MSAEMANEIKLISGRSHPELSGNIAKRYEQILPPMLPQRRFATNLRRGARSSLTRARPQARHRRRQDHLPQLLEPRNLLHRRRVGPRRGCLHRTIDGHGRRQRGADGAADYDLSMPHCEVRVDTGVAVCRC